MEKTLWYMCSDTIRGFYTATVVVCASNLHEAMSEAMVQYDLCIEKYIEDIGFHPLISACYPEDEFHAKEARAARDLFMLELLSNLKSVGNGFIEVSS
jgi:hypothetical protein